MGRLGAVRPGDAGDMSRQIHISPRRSSRGPSSRLKRWEAPRGLPRRDISLEGPALGPPRRPQPREPPLTFRAGELPEGGQRDDGVGDGVHGVQHAGDVAGTAGLDAAHGVRLLLAEPAGNHSTRGRWESRTASPAETRIQEGRGGPAAGGATGDPQWPPQPRCSAGTPRGPS